MTYPPLSQQVESGGTGTGGGSGEEGEDLRATWTRRVDGLAGRVAQALLTHCLGGEERALALVRAGRAPALEGALSLLRALHLLREGPLLDGPSTVRPSARPLR